MLPLACGSTSWGHHQSHSPYDLGSSYVSPTSPAPPGTFCALVQRPTGSALSLAYQGAQSYSPLLAVFYNKRKILNISTTLSYWKPNHTLVTFMITNYYAPIDTALVDAL